MTPPKYHQGERVVVTADSGNSNVRPGIYTISRVMPASPDGIQYRAKNEMETHERVLHEEQLRPAVDSWREAARSTSGVEETHRKRQQHRRNRALQAHAETGHGSEKRPDWDTADEPRAAPHR